MRHTMTTTAARLRYRCRHSETIHIPTRERVDSNGQAVVTFKMPRRIVHGPCEACRRQRRSSSPNIGWITAATDRASFCRIERRSSMPCVETAAGQLPPWFGPLLEGFETNIARHSTLRRARLSYSTTDRRRENSVRRKAVPCHVGAKMTAPGRPNLNKPLPALPRSPSAPRGVHMTADRRRRRQPPQPLELARALPQHAFHGVFAVRSTQTPPSPAWSFGSRFADGRGRALPTTRRDAAAEILMLQAGNAARRARRVGGVLATAPRESTSRLQWI